MKPPEAFAGIIVRMFRKLPEIELLQRTSRRGWDVRRDQIEGRPEWYALVEGDLEGRPDADPDRAGCMAVAIDDLAGR